MFFHAELKCQDYLDVRPGFVCVENCHILEIGVKVRFHIFLAIKTTLIDGMVSCRF